jgi:2-keto-3-deoxy-L-rhamnonate aldolase RhmA
MRSNDLTAKLSRGETAIGTLVMEFLIPSMPSLLDSTGIDFAVYDMEHTGASLETIRTLMAASKGCGPTPLVRVPATEYRYLAGALDAGAFGVVAPMVESAAQMREIVRAAKYPPLGERGAAFAVFHDDYEAAPLAGHMAALNNRSFVVAQIESETGLANLDDIAAVPGLDAIFIGPLDLTVSMGIPGKFDDPRFTAAAELIGAACREHGIIAGAGVGGEDDARLWSARGYTALLVSSDFRLFSSALRTGAGAVRRAVSAAAHDEVTRRP